MIQEEIETQAEEYVMTYHCERYCIGKCKNKKCVDLYLAGAKWGMEHSVEWHDLRKDPNDLPKESGYYWCRTEHDDRFWKHRPCLFTKTDGIFSLDVIAWCELPHFNDKDK